MLKNVPYKSDNLLWKHVSLWTKIQFNSWIIFFNFSKKTPVSVACSNNHNQSWPFFTLKDNSCQVSKDKIIYESPCMNSLGCLFSPSNNVWNLKQSLWVHHSSQPRSMNPKAEPPLNLLASWARRSKLLLLLAARCVAFFDNYRLLTNRRDKQKSSIRRLTLVFTHARWG